MMQSAPHILVVDDDERLRHLLGQYLSDQGCVVVMADSAAQARQMLELFSIDLVILDVMMPGETGMEFATKLRAESAIPILMLTAMSEAESRIEGLETGVDDYLTKPFEPRELVLRVRAILRRRPQTAPPSRVLRFGSFRFDPELAQLTKEGAAVYLTPAETQLLRALAECPGDSISREELAKSSNQVNERGVDVLVSRLRKKLEIDPSRPVFLQTVRNAGYSLFAEEETGQAGT